MRDWANRITGGDLRALARAATAVENRTPAALALLDELQPHAGRALVVGVTGPPGAGKSTLIDAMVYALRREDRTVGVITIDPTSPFTGGAILGDRIRMQSHHADPGVFIRSMATRGSLGGLSRAAAEMVLLLDAAGRDVILIETVGVGQAEVDIARLAAVTVVVLIPGTGDDVQAIKAGIMEIADVFAINKADLPGVERVEQEIRASLALAVRPDGWTPPVVRTVATEGTGIAELLDAVRSVPAKQRGVHAPAEGLPIDHLGIAVASLDDALAFWRDQLGLAATAPETVPAEQVRVAMLPAGASRIELLEPAVPDSVIAKHLERRGPGIHHVALRVPDLAAVVERLRAAGARIVNEPQVGAGGHQYVFVHPASTGGVLLELIQDQEESSK